MSVTARRDSPSVAICQQYYTVVIFQISLHCLVLVASWDYTDWVTDAVRYCGNSSSDQNYCALQKIL
uniref:Uncharacterized protein n=1 Tax=Babesia bovis TaxID=5865 RepID=S6BFU0_BABBO|nr:hypothetical protein [Babesia bovis]